MDDANLRNVELEYSKGGDESRKQNDAPCCCALDHLPRPPSADRKLYIIFSDAIFLLNSQASLQ